MPTINIANSKGRDAVVGAQSVVKPLKVRWLDEQGRQIQSSRLMKSDLSHDLAALESKAGGRDKVAQALIAGDPEIDVEYVRANCSKKPAACLSILRAKSSTKSSSLKSSKTPTAANANAARGKSPIPMPTIPETPLKWSGKLMKKKDVYNKFVFAGKRQVVHVNGLTYDFLYGMARELEASDSLMLLGAGPKGNMPLVLTRGGQQYRGFMEGRTQGDKYCLILHLSNMELKVPDVMTQG